MAAVQLKIRPLVVPETVQVELPGGEVANIGVSELDESTLAELVEEFSYSLLEKAGK